MNKKKCMVCGELQEYTYWCKDPYGIPWKLVCSPECEEKALEMLNPDYVNPKQDWEFEG